MSDDQIIAFGALAGLFLYMTILFIVDVVKNRRRY